MRSNASSYDVSASGANTRAYVSDSTLSGGGVSVANGAQVLSRGNNTLANTAAPFTGQYAQQ